MEPSTSIIAVKALFDMRAEAFIAMMLAQNAEKTLLEQWLLVPAGALKKRSAEDVATVERKSYHDETVYHVKVNRKGLFDKLPQGLFLDLESPYDNAKQRTDAFETQTADARKFLLPFEQAIYMPSVAAELLEQRLTENFPDFLETFWGLDRYRDCLDDRQRQILYHLLPEVHRITGDWALTSLCFELILQYPINIRFVAPKTYDNPQTETVTDALGDVILGDAFKEDIPTIQIVVRNVPQMALESFLEGGKNRKLLEEVLYGYFLPLDAAVETLLSIQLTDMGVELGKSVLGYDAMFNNN
jgi:hypothetical protein